MQSSERPARYRLQRYNFQADTVQPDRKAGKRTAHPHNEPASQAGYQCGFHLAADRTVKLPGDPQRNQYWSPSFQAEGGGIPAPMPGGYQVASRYARRYSSRETARLEALSTDYCDTT